MKTAAGIGQKMKSETGRRHPSKTTFGRFASPTPQLQRQLQLLLQRQLQLQLVLEILLGATDHVLVFKKNADLCQNRGT